MKKGFAFILLFFFMKVEAQNLVPNWSFEDTIQCPDNFGQLNRTQYWFNPTTGTPDYFNSCDTRTWYMNVPYTAFGFQNAHTGNAFSGSVYGGPNLTPPNNREYIEVQLTDSLINGRCYYISFYVSRANNCSMAISNIGCFLSPNAITSTNIFPLPVIPQIENTIGNYLTDTLDWMKISGTFVSSGGEKYITIGNFHDDSTTDSVTVDSRQYGFYYYFIDDVSVIPCEDTLPVVNNNFFVPNAFSPNGDGNNDFLFVRGKNIDQLSISVYDRWGQRVFQTNNINEGWDGKYNGEELENAVFVYFLTLTYSDGKTEVKKGNISLIR